MYQRLYCNLLCSDCDYLRANKGVRKTTRFKYFHWVKFLNYDLSPVWNKVYTTGATSGAGTSTPSGAHEFSPCFLVSFVLLNL